MIGGRATALEFHPSITLIAAGVCPAALFSLPRRMKSHQNEVK
jgi:hypothetical protein